MEQCTENENGGFRYELPETHRFVIIRNTKIVGADVNELLADFFYSVPVSISFNNAADSDFSVRVIFVDMFFYLFEVPGKFIEVYFGSGWIHFVTVMLHFPNLKDLENLS